MRRLATTSTALLLLAVACSNPEPLTQTTTETVLFESVDLPGTLWDPLFPALDDGTPVTIDARLTIPPTDEPVPLVVIAHGCGGVGASERGWVPDLADLGYASLIVDSFGGRGVGTICFGTETLNVASPIVDAFRARDAVADHPWIDTSRSALLGFSFGGRTALWSTLERVQERYDGGAFDAHVAFYPSTCYIHLDDETAVSDGAIRILHGTADDWTPLEPCADYVDRLAAAGIDAALLAYEGARHAFDNATLPSSELRLQAISPRACSFVEDGGAIIDPDTGEVPGVGSPCVQVGVTYGFDRSARQAAATDLAEILEVAFADGT